MAWEDDYLEWLPPMKNVGSTEYSLLRRHVENVIETAHACETDPKGLVVSSLQEVIEWAKAMIYDAEHTPAEREAA